MVSSDGSKPQVSCVAVVRGRGPPLWSSIGGVVDIHLPPPPPAVPGCMADVPSPPTRSSASDSDWLVTNVRVILADFDGRKVVMEPFGGSWICHTLSSTPKASMLSRCAKMRFACLLATHPGWRPASPRPASSLVRMAPAAGCKAYIGLVMRSWCFWRATRRYHCRCLSRMHGRTLALCPI